MSMILDLFDEGVGRSAYNPDRRVESNSSHNEGPHH